jgi:CO dehydrogenase/acetyl-CoA synthase beta subunit
VKFPVVDVTLVVLEDPISRGVSSPSKDVRLSRVTRAKASIGIRKTAGVTPTSWHYLKSRNLFDHLAGYNEGMWLPEHMQRNTESLLKPQIRVRDNDIKCHADGGGVYY